MGDLDIERYNLKLFHRKSVLKIFTRGKKLHLRGTLPLSPEDYATLPDQALQGSKMPRKQYRISANCAITDQNCRYLYHLCLEVTRKIRDESFSWGWLRNTLAELTPKPERFLNQGAPPLFFSGVGDNLSLINTPTRPIPTTSVPQTSSCHPAIRINPLVLNQRHLFPHQNSFLPIHPHQIQQCVEQLYYQRVIIKGINEHTWQLEYKKPIDFLLELAQASNVPITPALLEHIVIQIPRHSRKRKRYQCCYRILLEALGIVYPFEYLQGTYAIAHVQPQTLPSDPEIEQYYEYLNNKDSQWAKLYGVTATYGLRNVEHLYLDFSHYPNLYVKRSKTGKPRYVLPFHERWVDKFQITPDYSIPSHNRSTPLGFSHAVTTIFRELALPFRPKALRHCYARRMAELNYPAIYAAQLMGHSLQVHERTYFNFIGLESYCSARKSLVEQSP